ncbi:hypothetical protein BT96DRAFT_564447 [Gymnopus androsaceus JB14]|uniref:Uncharacterized protein n=1 Tax=Gymnopus androsaceus JB14 TaxID=1447944 RepID=A0A6A4HZ79_9AGAR|nr:hypothetical protein BT96DRAFT_564447 [Gymnopus androsaceus JB14]
MFGEDESESPRVPSPWDSLSSSPSPSPTPPSPLRVGVPVPVSLHSTSTLTPLRLPPESDLGNIEYKLHLLHPSTPRFTRLVTQLKWRLLEGGGQAYYELGVSDDGDLVGLSVGDLEASLETLEMMAGEIGASVVVVKEVEVTAAREDTRAYSDSEDDNTLVYTSTSSSEAGVEISSVFKPRPVRIRSVTTTATGATDADNVRLKPRINKWRKSRKKGSSTNSSNSTHSNPISNGTSTSTAVNTHAPAPTRRQARDRRRAEKRMQYATASAAGTDTVMSTTTTAMTTVADATATCATATAATVAINSDTTDTTAIGVDSLLEGLHIGPGVDVDLSASTSTIAPASASAHLDPDDDEFTFTFQQDELGEDEDDVFPSPTPFTSTTRPFSHTSISISNSHSQSVFPAPAPVDGALAQTNGNGIELEGIPRRLIVEALVVRKMDLSEAFLDFGGFGVSSGFEVEV